VCSIYDPPHNSYSRLQVNGSTMPWVPFSERVFSTPTVRPVLFKLSIINSRILIGDMWKYVYLYPLMQSCLNAFHFVNRFHRSMTRPFFSRDRISHFDLFDRHAEGVITQMKLRMRAGYAIDFQVRLTFPTLLRKTNIYTYPTGPNVPLYARLSNRHPLRLLRPQPLRWPPVPTQRYHCSCRSHLRVCM